MRVAVIIPTYNSASYMPPLLAGIRRQTRQPDDLLVIDSDSRDETASICEAAGARVVRLDGRKFNHGGTRRMASEMTDADIQIFLTHDAVPASEQTFEAILEDLCATADAGMAFGRQLPAPDATPLARHARLFNYPPESIVKRKADIPRLGLKTGWASDSFAAYRTDILRAVGGFPPDVNSCEDVWLASRMILSDYAVVYSGRAEVVHSHNYSTWQEFRRYFENGTFYGRNRWIHDEFSGAGGEGMRFVKSELRFLAANGHWSLFPRAIANTAAKLLGFSMGFHEGRLPAALKPRG